jgi:hypothetical protein
MIRTPIQITKDYHGKGYKPKRVSFAKFQSIFNTAVKLVGFDQLTISFDDDYRLLHARAKPDQDSGFPDLSFLFPRSLPSLNRIIKVFRSQYPETRISVPLDLLDRYSLIPKRLKVKIPKLKPIRVKPYSDWSDYSLDEFENLMRNHFGYLSINLVVISPAVDGLLWKLFLSHEIHDNSTEQIHVFSPATKKGIALILTVLDKEPFRCSIVLPKQFHDTQGNQTEAFKSSRR